MPNDRAICRRDEVDPLNAIATAAQTASARIERTSNSLRRLAGVRKGLPIESDYDLTWQPVHVTRFGSSLPVSRQSLTSASWPEAASMASSFSKYSRALDSLPARR